MLIRFQQIVTMESSAGQSSSEFLQTISSDAHYILPSDASESERLRLNHSMWKQALGG